MFTVYFNLFGSCICKYVIICVHFLNLNFYSKFVPLYYLFCTTSLSDRISVTYSQITFLFFDCSYIRCTNSFKWILEYY